MYNIIFIVTQYAAPVVVLLGVYTCIDRYYWSVFVFDATAGRVCPTGFRRFPVVHSCNRAEHRPSKGGFLKYRH